MLWPWPLGVDSTALEAPNSDVLASIAVASVAFIVVIVVATFAQRLEASDTGSGVTTSS